MAQSKITLPLLTLMVAAPFLAVILGLYVFRNAWLAVLMYHFQIVLFAVLVPRDLSVIRRGWSASWLLYLGIPCVLSGPLLFVLIERVLNPDIQLSLWLSGYGLSGTGLLLFVLYFGLLHPVLEQYHWDALRRDNRLHKLSHGFFASYHVLVLALVMKPAWVAFCFLVLFVASFTWAHVRERLDGLSVPILSHVIADAAFIGAVYLITVR